MKKFTILLLSMMMLSSWVFPVAIKATTQFENATVLTLPFDQDVDNTSGNVVKTTYIDESYGFIYKFTSDQYSAIEVQLTKVDEELDLLIELYEKAGDEYQLLQRVDYTMTNEYLYSEISANKDYYLIVAGYSKGDTGLFNVKVNECEVKMTLQDHLNKATSISSLPYEDTFNPLDYSYINDSNHISFGKAYQVDLKAKEIIYLSLNDNNYTDFVIEVYRKIDGVFHRLVETDNSNSESLYYLAQNDDTYYFIARALDLSEATNALFTLKKIENSSENILDSFETLQPLTLPYQFNQFDDCLYFENSPSLKKGVIYRVDVKADKDYTFSFNYGGNILTNIYEAGENGNYWLIDGNIANSFTYNSFADETLYFFSYELNESESDFSLKVEEINNGYRSVLAEAQDITLGDYKVKLTKDNLYLESVNYEALGKAYKIDLKEDKTYLLNINDFDNNNAYCTFYELIDGKYELNYDYISYGDTYIVKVGEDKTLYLLISSDEKLDIDHEIDLSIKQLQDRNEIKIFNSTESSDNEQFSYDQESATLTLKDGCDLKETDIYSEIDLTILVEGKASIQSNYDYVINGTNTKIKLQKDAVLNLESLDTTIVGNSLLIEGLDTNSQVNITSKYMAINTDSFTCDNSELNINAYYSAIFTNSDETLNLINSIVNVEDSDIALFSNGSINIKNTTLNATNILENAINVYEDLIIEDSSIDISSKYACISTSGANIIFKNSNLALDSNEASIIRLNGTIDVNIDYTNDSQILILNNADNKYIGRIDDNTNTLTFDGEQAYMNYHQVSNAYSISKDEVSYVDNKNGTHSIKYKDVVLTIEACYDFSDAKCIYCNNSISNQFTYDIVAGIEVENIAYNDIAKKIITYHKDIHALTNTSLTSDSNYRLFNVIGLKAVYNDKPVEVYNAPFDLNDPSVIGKTLEVTIVDKNDSYLVEGAKTYENGELHYVYPSFPANLIMLELVSDYEYLQLAIKQAENIDVSMASESTANKFNEMLNIAKQVASNKDASDEEYIEARCNLAQAYCDLDYIPFADIKEKDWFFKVVLEANELGLMGKLKEENGNDLFGPDVNISRGMVATVLYRMAGQPKVEFKATFSDVTNAKLWYSTAITWASKKGVVSGYKDGRFGPDDNITRQDLAIMLRNFAKAYGVNTNKQADLSKFIDANKVDSYANSAIAWCVEAGLISGSKTNEGTKLNPKNNASRAECAKMFTLLYNLLPSEG